jgi:hypothetical protein
MHEFIVWCLFPVVTTVNIFAFFYSVVIQGGLHVRVPKDENYDQQNVETGGYGRPGGADTEEMVPVSAGGGGQRRRRESLNTRQRNTSAIIRFARSLDARALSTESM